jgi:hypothetical protein
MVDSLTLNPPYETFAIHTRLAGGLAQELKYIMV